MDLKMFILKLDVLKRVCSFYLFKKKHALF